MNSVIYTSNAHQGDNNLIQGFSQNQKAIIVEALSYAKRIYLESRVDTDVTNVELLMCTAIRPWDGEGSGSFDLATYDDPDCIRINPQLTTFATLMTCVHQVERLRLHKLINVDHDEFAVRYLKAERDEQIARAQVRRCNRCFHWLTLPQNVIKNPFPVYKEMRELAYVTVGLTYLTHFQFALSHLVWLSDRAMKKLQADKKRSELTTDDLGVLNRLKDIKVSALDMSEVINASSLSAPYLRIQDLFTELMSLDQHHKQRHRDILRALKVKKELYTNFLLKAPTENNPGKFDELIGL